MEEINTLTLDQLYITPFTARREYDKEGLVQWIPVTRNLSPTGIESIDFILRAMTEGRTDYKLLARQIGCPLKDLWGWTPVLTGMEPRKFRHAYMFRLADDLLRYTPMFINDVARRSGFHSASLICQQYAKYRRTTPDEVRRAVRQPRDEGRFRL